MYAPNQFDKISTLESCKSGLIFAPIFVTAQIINSGYNVMNLNVDDIIIQPTRQEVSFLSLCFLLIKSVGLFIYDLFQRLTTSMILSFLFDINLWFVSYKNPSLFPRVKLYTFTKPTYVLNLFNISLFSYPLRYLHKFRGMGEHFLSIFKNIYFLSYFFRTFSSFLTRFSFLKQEILTGTGHIGE